MNPRNFAAWGVVTIICCLMFACGTAPLRPVQLEPLTRFASSSDCDFGVLRVTRSMRCEDEFLQRGWK